MTSRQSTFVKRCSCLSSIKRNVKTNQPAAETWQRSSSLNASREMKIFVLTLLYLVLFFDIHAEQSIHKKWSRIRKIHRLVAWSSKLPENPVVHELKFSSRETSWQRFFPDLCVCLRALNLLDRLNNKSNYSELSTGCEITNVWTQIQICFDLSVIRNKYEGRNFALRITIFTNSWSRSFIVLQ